MAWALDLDGVVWLGERPIRGAADAVATLRARGEPMVFCTNNSSRTVGAVEAQLARHGIEAEGAVVSSATAAAELVEAGERVLVCGGAGVVEALEARGAEPVWDGPADAVVVGLHLDFDYQRMRAAVAAVRGGARLLATNDDPTYPTPDGPIPGAGAIVAAVATAAGTPARVAGKPHGPMAELIRRRLGPTGTVVGDRPDTDGLLAVALGYRFALVLSGVTASPDGVNPTPDLVAADLPALVRAVSS